VLAEAGFDRRVEHLCQKYYRPVMGRPSIAPGVYFRMPLIGYLEGLDSERGIAWRGAGGGQTPARGRAAQRRLQDRDREDATRER